MKWLALVLRILVGLPMVVFGLNHFLKFMPMDPPPGMPENAIKLGELLAITGWLNVVKVLEILGGLILFGGRFVPLGLVILVPVTVNIAIWDALVVKYSMPPIGTILLVIEIILIVLYRSHFKPLFQANAQVG